MELFSELNEAFLTHASQTHESGWVYFAPADNVKTDFVEWLKQNHPDKVENADSLWNTFSYEYSAMLTM